MKPKRTVFQTFKGEEVLAGGQSNLKRSHRIYMPVNLKVVEGEVEVVDLGAVVVQLVLELGDGGLQRLLVELGQVAAQPLHQRRQMRQGQAGVADLL